MHPSEAIRGDRSKILEGRRIVLGVTGSIAAVKTVELARELVRHGATVVPVMSEAATRLIHPDALEFATGIEPVTSLTGATEHVTEVGSVPDGKDEGDRADLLLIAPCTGNTLSKIALGIDDTPVTTFASSGLTTLPTLIVPAMHESMYENPFLLENLERVREAGVTVLDPTMEEGKAKLPPVDEIVAWCLRLLSESPLAGRRLLVVTGSTIEDLDEMRVITNKSTGRMGVALAEEAHRLGADVTLWFGHGHVNDLPSHVPLERFVTVEDLLDRAGDLDGYDAVLVPAAISDYAPPKSEGKIPSRDGKLSLELEPLPKVVKAWRKTYDGALIPFKAESGVTEKELLERARRSIRETDAPLVVANDLEEVEVDRTRVVVVTEGDHEVLEGSKNEVSARVLERLAGVLGGGA